MACKTEGSKVEMIVVYTSSQPGAGYGAWTTTAIQPNTVLGSIEGNQQPSIESSLDIKPDADSLLHSNWMKFVKCARNKLEENLVAFPYRSSLFYLATKAISPNSELLVDYSHYNLCNHQQLLDLASCDNENKHLDHTCFTCKLCNIKFPSLVFVMKHVKFCSNLGSIVAVVTNSNNNVDLNLIQPCTVPNTGTNNKSNAMTKETCQCTECEKVFDSARLLLKHCAEQHDTKHNGLSGKLLTKMSQSNKTKNEKQCNVCGNSFSTAGSLKRHLIIHNRDKPYKCNRCGSSFARKQSIIEHMQIHTGGKAYKCDSCGASFSHKSSLKIHSRIHTKEKPYKCNICSKFFSQKIHLRTHTRVHTGEKPYKCNLCKASFSFSSTLRNHMFTHGKEKPYECHTCGSFFVRKKNLIRHFWKHTGVKPYKCDTCGKSFTALYNLNNHIKTHNGEQPYNCGDDDSVKHFTRSRLVKRIHSKVKQEAYICNICGNSYANKGYLSEHNVRKHTGEKPCKCDYCKKSFSTPSDLKRHIRTHTGEKPYKCDVCGACFIEKSKLRRHLFRHTGEKPFKCADCGKAFTALRGLNIHMKTHAVDKKY